MAAPTFTSSISTADDDGASVPVALEVAVSANDDEERLIFVSRYGRSWEIEPPAAAGDYTIPLARMGFVADAALTVESVNASTYWLADSQARTLLTTPIASTLPGKPVVTTNFTLGTFDPETGFAFDEAAQVDDGGGTIEKYIIKADAYGYQATALIADLPVDLPFAPDTVPGWPEGDDSFDVNFTVAAQNENGIGPASNAVTKTVAPTDSYYLDNSDWTATSIQAVGDVGNIDIAISGSSSFALVEPWDELWCYAGPVPALSGVTISSDTLLPSLWMDTSNPLMSQIDIGDTVRIPSGVAQGSLAYSVIAMRRSDTGRFFIISTRKTTTVLAPTVTAPTFASAPTISGLVSHSGVTKADVGVVLTLSGTATDATSYTSVFRLNGIAVGSPAASNSTTYTPVAADIGKTIDGRVTATNSGGTAGRNTAANYPVVDVAPTASGTIAAQSFETSDGAKSVAAATVTARFTGLRLTYALNTPNALGATINSSTGEITIPEQTAEISAQLTVSASNTGGVATLSAFTVAFSDPVDEFLFPPYSGWSFREVTQSDGLPSGTLIFTNASVTVPTGYQCGAYAVKGALPSTPPAMGATMAIGSGAVKTYNGGTFAVGDNVSATIYRIRTSDQELRANNTLSLTIQGFDTTNPPGTWTTPSNAILSDANNRPGERFNTSEPAVTQGGFHGGVHCALAYYAWISDANTQYDNKIVSTVQGTLGATTCPPSRAGFSMQLEITNAIALYTMCKLTPRLWARFSQTEKNKMEWLVRANAAAGAWSTADLRMDLAGSSGFVSKVTKMDGTKNNFPRGNPNYQMAPPHAVCQLVAFLGSAAEVNTWFNSGPASTISSQLSSLGLTNAAGSGNAWANPRPSGAPTFSEVNTCLSNWRFKGRGVLDFDAILKEQLDTTFSKACFTQHPQSASIDGRGRVVSPPPSAALTALNGRIGMPSEMASGDGNGIRTAGKYSWMEIRTAWVWTLTMLMAGLTAKNGATLQSVKTQCRTGWTWFDTMTRNDGWLDYDKGSAAGTWSYANNAQAYGYEINMGMWDLVLDMLG